MSMEDVESIAQGRVWTGMQALDAGLVDELGGLDACLIDLANRLGYSEQSMNVVHFRNAPRGWRRWRKRLLGLDSTDIETRLMAQSPLLIQMLQTYPNRGLVLLPFDVEGQ